METICYHRTDYQPVPTVNSVVGIRISEYRPPGHGKQGLWGMSKATENYKPNRKPSKTTFSVP